MKLPIAGLSRLVSFRITVLAFGMLTAGIAVADNQLSTSAKNEKYIYVSAQALHEPVKEMLESAKKEKSSQSKKANFYCLKDSKNKGEDFAKLEKDIEGQDAINDSLNGLWKANSCSESRLITDASFTLTVVEVKVVEGSSCQDIEPALELDFKKDPRKTQLVQDLIALTELKTLRKPLRADEEAKPFKAVYCQSAAKKISFSDEASSTRVIAKPKGAADDQKSEYALITGPRERMYLSIDGVLKGPKQLKYDNDKKTLSAKDKPDQVYIGVNYLINGDIYKNPGSVIDNPIDGRFVFKAMLKPSKKPFDSVGLGLGYRLGLPGSKLSDGAFMLFAGSFWTKGDRLDGTEVAVDRRYTQSWRFGVSYGLNAATDWLK